MTREKAVARVNALLKMTTANGATDGEEGNARELAIAMIRKYRIGWEELKDPPFTRAELEAAMLSKTAEEISDKMNGVLAAVAVSFEELAGAMDVLARELAKIGKTVEDVLIEYSDDLLFTEGKRVYRAREKGSDYGKRYSEPSRTLHLRKCGVHRSDTFRARR